MPPTPEQDRVRQEAERLLKAITPPPWVVWSYENSDNTKVSVCRHVGGLDSEDHTCVASVRGADTSIADANAEFTAAAPRLVRDLLAQVAALQEEARLARGAMAAQDAREREAGERCGVSYDRHGCDWPDAVADQVAALQATVEVLLDVAGASSVEDARARFIDNHNVAVKACNRTAEAEQALADLQGEIAQVEQEMRAVLNPRLTNQSKRLNTLSDWIERLAALQSPTPTYTREEFERDRFGETGERDAAARHLQPPKEAT